MKQATSTLYTHVDCPNCDAVFEVEGDQQGTIVVCTECDEECEL